MELPSLPSIDAQQCLGGGALLSFDYATFDEYYGGILRVSEDLQLNVCEAFREESGRALLDRVALCASAMGKRCFIVSSEQQCKELAPGSASDIFVTLLWDRVADIAAVLHGLEEQIEKLFPAGEDMSAVRAQCGKVVDSHVLSPFDVPEYGIEITAGEAPASIIVRVVQQSAETCMVLLDTVLSPFMVQSGAGQIVPEASVAALAQVRELIHHVAADASDIADGSIDFPSPISSQQLEDLSMGYCVTIPDVGDILISNGGAVVLDGIKTSNPLHIANQSSVVLKDVDAVKLSIESSSMVLLGQNKTAIDALSFQSNDGDMAAVYVDGTADVTVGELSLGGALLVNSGKVTITGKNTLDDVSVLNAGEIETTESLTGISHLWNCARGMVRSWNNLVVSAATVSNMGRMIAPQISIISECLLSNFGDISASNEAAIYGDGDVHNHGTIGGEDAEVHVAGERFRQHGDGTLRCAAVSINSNTAELSGMLECNKVSFGGYTAVLSGAHVGEVDELTLSTSDNFLANNGTEFCRIKKLINRGVATFQADLNDVTQVNNDASGELRLLNRTDVTGSGGILNDGHIFVHGGKGSQENNSLITGMESQTSALNIKGTYIGGDGALLEYANGATISAVEYNNHGTSLSHGKLAIEEHGGENVYGHVVAGDTIDYHVHGSIAHFGGHVIMPDINGTDKRFIVRADREIAVTTPFNSAVHMEMHAPMWIANKSDVTALSIGVLSRSDMDWEDVQSGTVVNRGTLSAAEWIEVVAASFLNDGGRMQAHGDIMFNVTGTLKNGGGGLLEKDVAEEITVFAPVPVPLNPNAATGQYRTVDLVERKIIVRRDIYHPELEKAGVITTDGGRIKVTSGRMDNSFGVLNAHGGIDISSLGEVINESGLMRSGGGTVINGKELRNGYSKASQVYNSVNPNRPITEKKTINGRWHKVPNMEFKKVGKTHWYRHRHSEWVQSGMRREDLPPIDDFILTGYESMPQTSTASTYPGYIFSTGDIAINTNLPAYLGTMVSGSNITARGESIGGINFKDRGTIIAHGDVNIEMQRAATDQVAIQAQNISIKVIEDFIINGIIHPTVLPDGTIIHMLDVNKWAHFIGLLNDNIKSAQRSAITADELRSTDACGFTGEPPAGGFILPTVPSWTYRTILNMFLAPMCGRDTLTQENLIAALERIGKERSSGNSSATTPAILYRPSDHQEVDVEIAGENTPVTFCDPMLILETANNISRLIEAHGRVSIGSMSDIQINPGGINIHATDIDLAANGKVSALSQFTYSQTGERTGVNPVKLNVPGSIAMSGAMGVDMQAAEIAAGERIDITSKRGNVSDKSMVTDMQAVSIDENTAVQKSTSTTTALTAGRGMMIRADSGTVDQHGTWMKAGEEGIVIEARRHTMLPSVEETVATQVRNGGRTTSITKVHSTVEIPAMMETSGDATLHGRDTTISGTDIHARKVINDRDGTIELLPGRGHQTTRSKTIKYGRIFGRASSEYTERQSTVVPTTITAEDISLTGVGTADLHSVIIKEADMHVTKQLSEVAAYDDIHTHVINRRKGWFAPRLRGDPAGDAVKAMLRTKAPGDILPNVANVVGAGAQTLAHITTLANLATMQHPVLSIAQIFLSRFTTGALYSDITQEKTRDEHIPVQSNVELGIFTVNNDRTHLEGIWHVDRASIDTGVLTTAAPQHTIAQREKVEGWSISFSQAAILASFVLPVSASTAVAVIPSATLHSGRQSESTVENVQMMLSASELFIRCNDAVFSCSQIRSKIVDAIVSGQLSVQSIANLFDYDAKQSAIGASLSAITGIVHNVTVDRSIMDHSTGAIPTIRIANQEAAIKQVDEVAALVGTEKFFLKVGEMLYNKGADIGLRPDGIVSDTGAERISAGTTLRERVDEMHHRSETVINPSIGELVAMAGQIDELKRIRAMVKEAAIAQNLKPADIDKLDKDAKEFLEQPEVKDSIDKLEKAEAELSDVTVQLAKLDADGNGVSPSTIGENVSPSRIEGNIPASTEGAMSNHAATESGTQAVLSPEYIALEANRNSLVHDVLKHITTLRQYSEKFAADHPNWAKAGSWALQGIGYVGAGALVKTGLKLGGKKMLALFGAHVLSQEVIASVIEHGTDALVDHAISYASTDQEAAEFAKTAVWTVEMLLDGTAIIGVAGLIKDKAAITNKLRANKVNVAATAKAKFAKKQHLQTESFRKISSILEEKNLMRAQQRNFGKTGTYKELIKDAPDGGFDDGMEAHHMPSKKYLKDNKMDHKEGFSVIMPEDLHRETRTFGGKATNLDTSNSYRTEMGRDILDYMKILKRNNSWTPEVRESLRKGLDNFKIEYPDLFKKVINK